MRQAGLAHPPLGGPGGDHLSLKRRGGRGALAGFYGTSTSSSNGNSMTMSMDDHDDSVMLKYCE